MKLHTVSSKRTNRIYCGPAAISAVSGRSIECAESWINYYRNARLDKVVVGSYSTELIAALHELGYRSKRTEVYDSKNSPTLAAWLRKRSNRNAMVIVVLTSHFVVVKGNKFVDNFTMNPVFIRKAPHRRSRVKEIISVTTNETPEAGKRRRKRSDIFPSIILS